MYFPQMMESLKKLDLPIAAADSVNDLLTAHGRMSTIGSIESRMSSMAKQTSQRRAPSSRHSRLADLASALLWINSASTSSEPRHDFLQMQQGSLYPALHRLERRRWVISKWEMAPDGNREFKYKGRRRLVVEESQWKHAAEAVARLMGPVR